MEHLSRVGVLLIRVWSEGDGFRARIIESLDVTKPDARVTRAAATHQDVYDAVRAWLEAFAAGARE